MNAKEFFDKVVEMRKLQKEYFSKRDVFILKRAKQVEAEIDAEILVKNGFVKRKANFTPDWCWYVLTDNCFLEDRLKNAFHFNGNNLMKLKYVHELQHALRLCGIEKEIVL